MALMLRTALGISAGAVSHMGADKLTSGVHGLEAFWEERFSGKKQVQTFVGPSAQEVSQQLLCMGCPSGKTTKRKTAQPLNGKSYSWSKLGAKRNIDQPRNPYIPRLPFAEVNMFLLSLVGMKRNLSSLDIFVFFPVMQMDM